MSYDIRILDKQDKQIGELMTASPSDILKFIDKGFKVFDITTKTELTADIVNSSIGVSDGLISM